MISAIDSPLLLAMGANLDYDPDEDDDLYEYYVQLQAIVPVVAATILLKAHASKAFANTIKMRAASSHLRNVILAPGVIAPNKNQVQTSVTSKDHNPCPISRLPNEITVRIQKMTVIDNPQFLDSDSVTAFKNEIRAIRGIDADTGEEQNAFELAASKRDAYLDTGKEKEAKWWADLLNLMENPALLLRSDEDLNKLLSFQLDHCVDCGFVTECPAKVHCGYMKCDCLGK